MQAIRMKDSTARQSAFFCHNDEVKEYRIRKWKDNEIGNSITGGQYEDISKLNLEVGEANGGLNFHQNCLLHKVK